MGGRGPLKRYLARFRKCDIISLSMLIGHQAQLDFLRRSLQAGKLSHAYLFVGPDRVGKKTMAKEVSDWVLGRKDDKTEMSHDTQIKFVERVYDEKTGKKHKDIAISQIHEVRDFINHHALIGSYKVVIIDEASRLNQNAANALLKTLEEPSPKTLIILLAVDDRDLLPTIVSRCQVTRFYPVSQKEIYSALVNQGAGRETAREISRLSFGLPGRALELFAEPEKLKFYQTERERFWKLLKGDLNSRFKALADLFPGKETDQIETRDNLRGVLEIWLGLWRDVLTCQSGAKELVANISTENEIEREAKRYRPGQIAQIISRIEAGIRLLRQNVNPRLLAENLILTFY